MSYSLFIERSAQKELGKIAKPDRKKIAATIKDLESNPHPAGSKKLSGREAWRMRIGNYRVIYEINENNLIILVIKIGHRQGVYSK